VSLNLKKKLNYSIVKYIPAVDNFILFLGRFSKHEIINGACMRQNKLMLAFGLNKSEFVKVYNIFTKILNLITYINTATNARRLRDPQAANIMAGQVSSGGLQIFRRVGGSGFLHAA
jgi:hypothetical protein